MTKLRMKDTNIDDKTINLSTEEAKTCGKSVKTDTEDEAIKAKLNAVYRLRLLYNSGEELWKHIGKAGSGETIPLVVLVEKMLFYAEPYFTSWSVNGMTKRALFLMAC